MRTRVGQILLILIVLLISLTVSAANTKKVNNLIHNPGFEKGSGGKNFKIPGWTVISEKDKNAAFTESGWTHSGQNKFTNWKDTDFKVYAYQTVKKIPEGVYNFEFWYANGDGAKECYVELKNFGGAPIKIAINKSGSWTKLGVKDIKITTGKCLIEIYSDAKAGYWINMDDFLLYNQRDLPAGSERAVREVKKNYLINGSFERGEKRLIANWQVNSDQDSDAVYREQGWAKAGEYKLTNWKNKDYRVDTYQTVRNLKNGTYALEFWYANGGKQNTSYVEIRDFGGQAIRETLPTNVKWGRVKIPNIQVENGQCVIEIHTDAYAGYWINLDDFSLSPDEQYKAPAQIRYSNSEYPLQVKGVDLSTLPQVEAGGGKFYNFAGESDDVFNILKENGINYVRLRVWNNPKNGICGEASMLAMARRIKNAGMGFLLDFHYSDTWADPGKQGKPAAWKDLGFEELKKAVYEYTKGVINDCKKQGTLPEMVQIGNEIRNGMLFPDGKLTNAASFNKLAQLIKSGVRGVRDAQSPGESVKIMIHLDKGGDHDAYTYFFDNLLADGVEFDIIGLSYYIVWHGNPGSLYRNMRKLAEKYHKDLIVVETAFPFCLNDADELENIIAKDDQIRNSGYTPTIAGQKQYLEDLIMLIKHIPNGRGLGLFYWEGAWLPVKGAGWDPENPESKNAWENQCLFNFDGYALDSLKAFN